MSKKRQRPAKPNDIARPPFQKQTEISSPEEIEAMIDETIDETFPASDPPNWSAIQKRADKNKRTRKKTA